MKVERSREKLDEIQDYGEDIDWKQLKSPASYYPTRLEYLAGKVLSGILTGKSLKEYERLICLSVELAKRLGEELDKAQER